MHFWQKYKNLENDQPFTICDYFAAWNGQGLRFSSEYHETSPTDIRAFGAPRTPEHRVFLHRSYLYISTQRFTMWSDAAHVCAHQNCHRGSFSLDFLPHEHFPIIAIWSKMFPRYSRYHAILLLCQTLSFNMIFSWYSTQHYKKLVFHYDNWCFITYKYYLLKSDTVSHLLTYLFHLFLHTTIKLLF